MVMVHSSPNWRRLSFRPERSEVEEPAIDSLFSESRIGYPIPAQQGSNTATPTSSQPVTIPAPTSSNEGVFIQN
jgi:hypothetical protein